MVAVYINRYKNAAYERLRPLSYYQHLLETILRRWMKCHAIVSKLVDRNKVSFIIATSCFDYLRKTTPGLFLASSEVIDTKKFATFKVYYVHRAILIAF